MSHRKNVCLTKSFKVVFHLTCQQVSYAHLSLLFFFVLCVYNIPIHIHPNM